MGISCLPLQHQRCRRGRTPAHPSEQHLGLSPLHSARWGVPGLLTETQQDCCSRSHSHSLSSNSI